MILKFVETGGQGNWGKFAVGMFDNTEWREEAKYPGCEEVGSLLRWGCFVYPDLYWVLDLQTKEGAMFHVGYGLAVADLRKHQIWVCPMYETFLVWLYKFAAANPKTWWDILPRTVDLPHTPFEFAGYRRQRDNTLPISPPCLPLAPSVGS